jgi:peptidoglycan/xylan/chitin deacetylase (PgdA/CDA1 family)
LISGAPGIFSEITDLYVLKKLSETPIEGVKRKKEETKMKTKPFFLLSMGLGAVVACGQLLPDSNETPDNQMSALDRFGVEDSISGHLGDGKSTGDRMGLVAGEVALTLDDGPAPESLGIAKELSAAKIPVTYFMIGRNVKQYAGTGLEIAKLPYVTISNHSMDHRRRNNSVACIACDGADYAIAQVMNADAALLPLYQVNKPNFYLFRAPGGNFFRRGDSSELAELDALNRVASKYVGPVRWDVDGDVNPTSIGGCGLGAVSARECANKYLRQIVSQRSQGKSSVILAHDIHAYSREMVRYLVADLKSNGFRFVELAKDPAKVAALGKVKPNNGNTEIGSVTFQAKSLGNATYSFLVTAKGADRTELWVDRKTDAPLLAAQGETLEGTYTFANPGIRYFEIRGYSRSGALVARSSKTLNIVNSQN